MDRELEELSSVTGKREKLIVAVLSLTEIALERIRSKPCFSCSYLFDIELRSVLSDKVAKEHQDIFHILLALLKILLGYLFGRCQCALAVATKIQKSTIKC